MTILHLDSSPRAASHSRALSAEAVASLQARFPGATVVYHDLGREPLPVVSEAWIGAAYSDPATHTPELTAAIALSNSLIAELKGADVIVAGVPMYNFSIPAAFKLWIDQVVRAGVTFSYPGYEGLAGDKPTLFVTARGGGGYGPGEVRESANFEDPYLKTAFAFIGIKNTHFAHINNAMDDGQRPAEIEAARERIAKFVASVATPQGS